MKAAWNKYQTARMMVCFLSDISSLLNWQRVKTNKMAAFTEYVRSSLDNIKTEECMQRKIILLQTLHDRLKGNSLQEYNIFIEEKKLYYDLMIFLTDSGLVKKSFENELGRVFRLIDSEDIKRVEAIFSEPMIQLS
ncbi:uncharacterized protein LOC111636438 [Centruroides sculpturatus]|uniref:uncharacterized protein LOC111636438 n=1 Tax=Centruroides sculpturatus TaxID=218467 RepID=UPI000C6E7234|nr:uncharacterized protein LOC111636438 [Centruroides sculpturatus]